MNMNEYQALAHETTVYPTNSAMAYTALGLSAEAGEYANKVKKIIRGDKMDGDMIAALTHELGDALWYLSECAGVIGVSLEVVAQANLYKLNLRKLQGTLKGSGDDR